MTENVVTMISTKKYKEGWNRVFGGKKKALWRCPKCKKVVDYGEGKPTKETLCCETGQCVKMMKVKK